MNLDANPEHRRAKKIARLKDTLRAFPWLVGAAVTTMAIAVIAPQQLGVLIWSLSKLSFGAYLGYWVDRSIFHYARPDEVADDKIAAAWIRRAIIMAAAMISLALGV